MLGSGGSTFVLVEPVVPDPPARAGDGGIGVSDGREDVERAMTNWNYGDVWETVAEVQPKTPAVTQGTRHVVGESSTGGPTGSHSISST